MSDDPWASSHAANFGNRASGIAARTWSALTEELVIFLSRNWTSALLNQIEASVVEKAGRRKLATTGRAEASVEEEASGSAMAAAERGAAGEGKGTRVRGHQYVAAAV